MEHLKKNWGWYLAGVVILLAVAYQMKWFGNEKGFFAVGGIVNPDMPGTGGGGPSQGKPGSFLTYSTIGRVTCPAGTTLFLGTCTPNATTRISQDVKRFINSGPIANQPPINKEECLCGSGKVITCIGYKNCSACCKDDNYPN